jgi:hypothetical protein
METPDAIMALERKFWQALVDGEVEAAVALLDSESIVAGGGGIERFTPGEYRERVLGGPARLVSFRFLDGCVLFPLPDLAIAAYSAEQAFRVNDAERTQRVHDTTTWIRRQDGWRAAAHTEAVLEDASRKR